MLDENLESVDIEVIANVDGDADTVKFELSFEGKLVAGRTVQVRR